MQLGRDEVLFVPNKWCCFSVRSALWGIQGRAKIGTGVPFFKEFRLQKRRLQRQTEYIAMMKKHAGKNVIIFWFHSEVTFLTRFDVFLNLIILMYLNIISTDLYVVKCLFCIYFV